jgi:hypothetical protein
MALVRSFKYQYCSMYKDMSSVAAPPIRAEVCVPITITRASGALS